MLLKSSPIVLYCGVVSRFNPSCQLTTQLLSHFPFLFLHQQQWGRESGKKMEFMGCDKNISLWVC